MSMFINAKNISPTVDWSARVAVIFGVLKGSCRMVSLREIGEGLGVPMKGKS